MRRLPLPLLPALLLLLLSGCAYYNTFYTARKAWDRAMVLQEQSSIEGTGVAEFDNCIKACNSLILKYPDSKWVDDALLLQGRCYLAKGEYDRAIERFELLRDSIPKSPLVPEAMVGKARTQARMRRYEDAESTLVRTRREYPEGDYLPELLLAAGDIRQARKDSRGAIQLYSQLLRDYPKSILADPARASRGESYFQLEQWDSARVEFENAAIAASREEDRYTARLRMGETYEQARRWGDAITHYRLMLSDARKLSKEPEVLLRIAWATLQEGEVDKAVDQYTRIKELNVSNRFSSSAAYQLGYIQEVYKEDFEEARKYYQMCQTLPRSEFTDLARQRSDGLGRAVELKKKLSEGHSKFDARAEDAYKLAELYLFEMKKEDRALLQYREVERQFSFTRFGPKAAYAIGWVWERMGHGGAADSAFARVVVRYPGSEFARAAADTLRARHGAALDSLVAVARSDSTNQPLHKPVEAVQESIQEAAQADSMRKAALADSIRRIAVVDSLQRKTREDSLRAVAEKERILKSGTFPDSAAARASRARNRDPVPPAIPVPAPPQDSSAAAAPVDSTRSHGIPGPPPDPPPGPPPGPPGGLPRFPITLPDTTGSPDSSAVRRPPASGLP